MSLASAGPSRDSVHGKRPGYSVRAPSIRLHCMFPLILTALSALAGCGSAASNPSAVPTATRSSITLTTDFPSYSASQAIGVTVHNGTSTTYYAADNHSECTIIQLQERVHGAWVDMMPCSTGQQPNVLAVPNGSSVPYTLAPGNAHDSPNAWDPGTYRVALTLGTNADGSNLSTLVYSAGFVVRAS